MGDLYPIEETERAALAALEKVLACPEAVAEALAVHREGAGGAKLTPDEVRRRLRCAAACGRWTAGFCN